MPYARLAFLVLHFASPGPHPTSLPLRVLLPIPHPQSQNTSPTYAAPVHQQMYPQAQPNVVYAQPVSPTSAAKKQPFLKRIFGSNGSNYNTRTRPDAHVAANYGGGGHRRRTASMHY